MAIGTGGPRPPRIVDDYVDEHGVHHVDSVELVLAHCYGDGNEEEVALREIGELKVSASMPLATFAEGVMSIRLTDHLKVLLAAHEARSARGMPPRRLASIQGGGQTTPPRMPVLRLVGAPRVEALCVGDGHYLSHTCDWGGCDEVATHRRWSSRLSAWLPVCPRCARS